MNEESDNFEGKSSTGNLQEALENAIHKAQVTIPSELIYWHLSDVKGSVGGVVGANDITVSVTAHDAGVHAVGGELPKVIENPDGQKY